MRKRIFYSICAVALACLLVFGGCVVGLLYQKATADGFERLHAQSGLLAEGYALGGEGFVRTAPLGQQRATLTAADGTVLYDSHQPADTLPNHADRPEIAAALASGAGQAQRQSDTFGQRLLYVAVRLPDGNVLRLSLAVGGVLRQVLRLVPWLAVLCAAVVVLAALVARALTRRLLAPIAQIDATQPLAAPAYDELAPLLRQLSAQQRQLEQSTRRFSEKQAQFDLITQQMAEGLVVTGKNGQVLHANPSALALLGVAQAPAGTPFVALSRDLALGDALAAALSGRAASTLYHTGGRIFRVMAHATTRAGQPTGAVLLFVDDTEAVQAEQLRREFTANVSHELKTPLTSISGYAELLQTGLAQPADTADFAARIHSEATRLVALIDDIIKLSQLDEKGPQLAFAPVDADALAAGVVHQLAPAAQKKDITLAVSGSAGTLPAVESLLVEILYNLVDNAIRYSPPGSTVQVALARGDAHATLTVTDNGPGIAPQHQPRVFERFYRVDKSHSKQSGGTGLGLSIVKNGATYHGGTVSLASTPGQGSSFTVTLPLTR